MTAPTLQETLSELTELSQFFIAAEASIKNGQNVDMAGIDARVSTLCHTVQTAVPDQQQIYLPELNMLLNLLNACELALRLMQSQTPAVPQHAE